MNARMPSTGKPNHIMTGIDRPDGGVRLYASRELPRDVGFGQRDMLCAGRNDVTWHIDADMANVLIIDAPTWGEAYARVFEIWGNWDTAGRELPEAGVTARPGQLRGEAHLAEVRPQRVLDGPAHPSPTGGSYLGLPAHDSWPHKHDHEDDADAGEPHEHPHTGSGHMGLRHSHPHTHARS